MSLCNNGVYESNTIKAKEFPLYLPECTMITGIVAFRIVSRAVLPKKALNNAFLP